MDNLSRVIRPPRYEYARGPIKANGLRNSALSIATASILEMVRRPVDSPRATFLDQAKQGMGIGQETVMVPSNSFRVPVL